jgi:hypothetical protein
MKCHAKKQQKDHPTHGSSAMEALRNLFDEKDLENAPSLFDKPANPAGVAESVASDAGGPAVVWARPQFRRRVADDPMIPVKLVCCCC